MAEDVTLRVQLVDEVKPGTPSAPPAPITPPSPVPPPTSPVTQANSLAGIPQPEPVYQGVGFVAGPIRGADLPPPSSPERPSPGFRPGEDKLTDVIRELRDKFSELDDAVDHFHQTVQATDRTWESIPLPFTEDTITDEKDFNDFGISLSRETTREDNARLPPLMPPGWRPPVDAEAVSQQELDRRNRAYHTPPAAPEPIQAPPINPMASRRAFGLAAKEKLGQVAATLGTQLPGIVGSSVGAGVGAATGSGTIGALAGTGAASLATLLPAAGPAGIALGAVAVGAVGAVEAFKKLRAITNELATSIVGINGQVTAASARAEVQALQNKLYTSREVGGVLASNVKAESELDAALNKFYVEIVREFGPLVNLTVQSLAAIVNAITTVEKTTGLISNSVETVISPLLPVLIWAAKWLQIDLNNQGIKIDQAVLDFLNPSKVDEIPFPNQRKRANAKYPGGIF